MHVQRNQIDGTTRFRNTSRGSYHCSLDGWLLFRYAVVELLFYDVMALIKPHIFNSAFLITFGEILKY